VGGEEGREVEEAGQIVEPAEQHVDIPGHHVGSGLSSLHTANLPFRVFEIHRGAPLRSGCPLSLPALAHQKRATLLSEIEQPLTGRRLGHGIVDRDQGLVAIRGAVASLDFGMMRKGTLLRTIRFRVSVPMVSFGPAKIRDDPHQAHRGVGLPLTVSGKESQRAGDGLPGGEGALLLLGKTGAQSVVEGRIQRPPKDPESAMARR